jgi:signal peptidase II
LPETNEAPGSVSRSTTRTLFLLGLVAVCVYIADQAAKFGIVSNLSLGEERKFLGGLLTFHYVENSGAAFSLGSGSTWIFAVIATLVATFIIVFAHRIKSFGWASVFGLLLGGTLGNLTDRLFRPPGFGTGHVIDFLQVYGFPAIFNVADIAIVTSMGLFIILSIRGIGLDGKRTRHSKKSAEIAESADGT